MVYMLKKTLVPWDPDLLISVTDPQLQGLSQCFPLLRSGLSAMNTYCQTQNQKEISPDQKVGQDLTSQWRWAARGALCIRNTDYFLWISPIAVLNLSQKPGSLWRAGHYLPTGKSGIEASPTSLRRQGQTLHQLGKQWGCFLLPRDWQESSREMSKLRLRCAGVVFQMHPPLLEISAEASKKARHRPTIWPSFLEIFSRDSIFYYKLACSSVFIAALFTIAWK